MEILAIGSDHAGFELKEELKAHLESTGQYQIKDFGCPDTNSVDYPNIAQDLARFISDNNGTKGILICGSGIGVSIAANRFKGVRAALCPTKEYAELSRLHNNSNVIALGARFLKTEEAQEIVETWLTTSFDTAERHARRVDSIDLV